MTIESMATFPPAIAGRDLTDLVELYTAPDDLPTAEWLKRYSLARPNPGLKTLRLETRVIKRLMDVVIAASLLLLLAPLLFVVGLLVKLTSPGPVIFRQMRIGLNLRGKTRDRRDSDSADSPPPEGLAERRVTTRDRRLNPSFGKPFVLYKLRTMRLDAEQNGACFAVERDPRVTPIGRMLRKSRLDELPQLWNVLRGEMSLVGPRPERPEFIADLSAQIPGYLHRLRLKPGITGLAQVINGYDNNLESFRKKVALDLLYLQNCSVWNDIKIVFRTIGVIFTGKGAL